jgi:Flp pilus assembly pilin Flp
MMISLRRLSKREDGQDLMEYALLVALIALFTIGAMTLVSDQINNVLWAAIAINI